MSSFFRSSIALFAAFAVLIGCLEHEDLVLQGSESAQAGAHSPAESFSVEDRDSGTEGTFRFHLPRLWLYPRAAGWKPPRIGGSKATPLALVVQDRRAALAAHVALRL